MKLYRLLNVYNMGGQSQEVSDVFTIIEESTDILKNIASDEYNSKYFAFNGCETYGDKKLNFLIKMFFDPCNKTIGGYIERKLNGVLDNEYRKKKIINSLHSIEFEWECLDMDTNVGDCCDWRAIEW